MHIYRDRTEAGEQLAETLAEMAWERPIVLALPRGGVPVAVPVAERLQAPLDVLISRKLGAPLQPELGFGALSEGGALWIDMETVQILGLGERAIGAIAARAYEELERRIRAYRGGRPLDLHGHTAILVDDGVATGGTLRAAIRAARALGADHVVAAVPVAAPETARAIEEEVDDWICLEEPEGLGAIGLWYRSFPQLDDVEVLRLLALGRAGAEAPALPPGEWEAEDPF